MQPLVHPIEADTCPQAWLKAVEYLSSNHDSAYNLVLAVRRPEVLTPADFAIHDLVDEFLREHGRPPLTTIAGTIFPANFYLHGGADDCTPTLRFTPGFPVSGVPMRSAYCGGRRTGEATDRLKSTHCRSLSKK